MLVRVQVIGLDDVTVIGSGQSGAEVLLDLVRTPPAHGARLRWLTRSPALNTGPLPCRSWSTTRKLMNASSAVHRCVQPSRP